MKQLVTEFIQLKPLDIKKSDGLSFEYTSFENYQHVPMRAVDIQR